jgi:hypothetical protein
MFRYDFVPYADAVKEALPGEGSGGHFLIRPLYH